MFESMNHKRVSELVGIQILRGIAALMIVIYHVQPQLSRMGHAFQGGEFLASGVDIFFVISGFIMVYSTAKSPDRGAAAFLLNRAIRVVPLYFLLTAFVTSIAIAFPQLLQSTEFDFQHVLFSFLFIPYPDPVTGNYWPVLIVGWTLNYEMYFYALFACGLIVSRGRLAAQFLIVVSIICIFAVLPIFFETSGIFEFYTESIILEFALGMLVGIWFVYSRDFSSIWPLLSVLAGILLLLFWSWQGADLPRFVAFGIPGVLIVGGLAQTPFSTEAPGVSLLRSAGDASYSIYLSHPIVMSAAGQAWRKTGLADAPHGELMFGIFSVGVCVAAGILFYRMVERPLTKKLKRRFTEPHENSGGTIAAASSKP